MIWKKKCPACEQKYPKAEAFHEVRLQLTDQILTLEICSACADFLDAAADTMTGKPSDEPI
jgi:hypothetical protein